MNFQFDIAPHTAGPPPLPATPETVPDLLRQILEVQREQLHQARATAPDNLARWRHMLGRWQNSHPEFGAHCQKAFPVMERAYVQLLANMIEEIAQQGDEALENEFAVQEFLDRYGMKIGQLSHLLSIIGPLSEAAHQQDEAAKQQG
jgi:hypothetical protein